MIADAPTATSSSATPLPAIGQASSATTPTVAGAISPCRRIGFIDSLYSSRVPGEDGAGEGAAARR
jgi:hypothetical protein